MTWSEVIKAIIDLGDYLHNVGTPGKVMIDFGIYYDVNDGFDPVFDRFDSIVGIPNSSRCSAWWIFNDIEHDCIYQIRYNVLEDTAKRTTVSEEITIRKPNGKIVSANSRPIKNINEIGRRLCLHRKEKNHE